MSNIAKGICPECGSKLRETRGDHRGAKWVKDPKGKEIRTDCPKCRRFVGYRWGE